MTPELKLAAAEIELRSLLARARRQLKRRDWRGALASLERSRLIRDTGTVRSLMAEAHRGLGNMKDAIKHQQVAIKREPRKIEHYLQLSRLHAGRGDVPAACQVLSGVYRSHKGHPQQPQIRGQLARYACPEP
jgi:uncharacterized protein HemY